MTKQTLPPCAQIVEEPIKEEQEEEDIITAKNEEKTEEIVPDYYVNGSVLWNHERSYRSNIVNREKEEEDTDLFKRITKIL